MKQPLGTPGLIVLAAIGLLSTSVFPAAAQTSSSVLAFESVADLRAYSTSAFGSTAPEALTGGYYAAGDGGGNRFVWSGSSTAADNDGSIIKPSAIGSTSPGRWLATSSIFNAKTFGAKGDGATNDTAKINKVIAAANALGKPVHFPKGDYLATNGGLATFQYGIDGPEAAFISADTTEAALITVEPAIEGTNHRIRQLRGQDESQHGVGILIRNANQCWFWINDIRWFNIGFFLDGEGSAAHMSINRAWIGKLAECYDGLRFTSGPLSNDWNEGNYIWVAFSHGHLHSAAYLGNDGSGTEIHDNTIHFGSMEVNHVSGSNGIMATSIANHNTFMVDAGLGGAAGNGKDIIATGSYNRFFLAYLDWDLITPGLNFWEWRNLDGSSGSWSPADREFAGGSGDTIRLSNAGGSTQFYALGRDVSDGHLKFTGTQTGYIGYDFNGPISATQENWSAPTLLNGWTNFGSGWQTAGYYKDTASHRVYLRGMITGGDAGATKILFTLPSGYRPTAVEMFPIGNVTTNARIYIDTSGNVALHITVDSSWISLNGISFRVD